MARAVLVDASGRGGHVCCGEARVLTVRRGVCEPYTPEGIRAETRAPLGPVDWVMAIYLLMLPFDNVMNLPGVGTVTKYIGIIVGGLAVVDQMWRHRGRVLRPTRPIILWGAFVSIAVASTLWSLDPAVTVAGLDTIVGLYFVYVGISARAWTARSVELLSVAAVAGGVLASLIAVWQWTRGIGYLWTTRTSLVVSSTRTTDPNHFAASLLLPFMLALAHVGSRGRPKVAYWLSTIIIGLAVLLTGSRGGGFALGAGAAVVLSHAVRRMRLKDLMRRAVPLVLLAGAAAYITWLIVPPSIWTRFTMEQMLASGASGRFPLWALAIRAFEMRPWLGWGYDTFAVLSRGTVADVVAVGVRPGQVAHSIYLQSVSELGVFGATILVGAMATQYFDLRRGSPRTPIPIGVLGALVAVAVVSASLGTLNYKYFWATQALGVIASRLERRYPAQAGPTRQATSRVPLSQSEVQP